MADLTRPSSGSNNDPFEEFEFRPINSGLGFHGKQKSNSQVPSSQSSTAAPTAPSAKKQLQNLAVQSMDLTMPQTKSSSSSQGSFHSPLPRSDSRMDNRSQIHIPTIEDDSISKAQTAVNDILKSLNQKRQIDFVQDTAKQKLVYKKSKPQLFAAVLDGMLIVSAFLMSLIVMLSITKVDLFLNLSHPQTSSMIYVATAALFLAIHFIYMVVNRAFAGFTPGEWAFDQICGREEQSEELSYIPKLVFRTLLVAVTGFVVLPFLSFLFNKDIAGEMTGLSLLQKPNV